MGSWLEIAGERETTIGVKNYMKRFNRGSLKSLAGLAIAGGMISNAAGIGFVNGDFEGYLGNTDSWNSEVPPGWTTTGGTPDTFDANTSFQNNTFPPSNSGGQFLHGIGWQPTWTESAVQQAVTGLTVGAVYEISFEQTITRNIWSETGGFWRITFGTEAHDSAHMNVPDDQLAKVPWTWHTMYFTATSDTQALYVSAISDTDGKRTDLVIDGFYLGVPRPNPPGGNLPPRGVPDGGSTVAMLAAALAMFGRVVRCKA